MEKRSRIRDADYLRETQYRDDRNLAARVVLHDRFSENPKGWFPWLRDRLRAVDGAQVLEVGTGPGYLWRGGEGELTPRSLLLSDFSPGIVTKARRELRKRSLDPGVCTCDAQALPFPDARFEVVIANHMLYHVPDRERALIELERVLAPGGRFFASTVGRDHMAETFSLALEVDPDPSAWMGPEPVGFTLENGGAELERHFTEVGCESYPDGLRVTEPEPLLDYIASMASLADLSPQLRSAIRDRVEQVIAKEGVFRVRKSSGLFSARKASRS